MISVSDLSKSFGGQTLFEGVTLELSPPNRYGLVGANGSGKSTFARILAGDEPASGGTLSIPKRVRVGVLRQDRFESDEQRILDVVLMGNREVYDALKEREGLLARADQGDFDGERFAALEDVIARHDGYTLEARGGEILEGLGIPSTVHNEPLRVLSGGFKLRVLLAQTLASSPDLLVLDEPTNHLDILSIRWLERFLVGFSGCAVIISHDRRFLDNVCTHIADVDYETITVYPGSYASFEVQKAEERARKQAEIDKREKEIAHHQDFVDRFRAKNTKARQAQSRIKQIEKIVIERLPDSSRRHPRFAFSPRRPSGREVLEIEGVSKSFGDKKVLEGVSLLVRRGERVAVIGPNGVGKSTLLKIVTGRLAADQGSVKWGHETYPGYFAQDHRDLLSGAGTIESWLWEALPEESKGSIRSRLGAVLFSGDEADKSLTSLSGGEAARVIFARLAAEQPNVLILDEPTNHLDIEAIEALTKALQEYEGTLLFVSHDRWFVSQLANRVLEVRPGGVFDYQGSYDEYVAHTGDDHLSVDVTSLKQKKEAKDGRPVPTAQLSRAQRRQSEKERKKLEKKRDATTADIEAAEARLGEIHTRFCEPGFFEKTAPDDVSALQAEQAELTGRVEALMAEWESLEEELASLEA